MLETRTGIADQFMTGEALAELGDIGRCELVDGRIVMKSPTGWLHGDVEHRIGYSLGLFVDQNPIGRVLVGEVGIYTRRHPDTVRGADVIFISNERLAQTISKSYLDIAPELVVEVMSPDDRWTEVKQKLREYFALGVILVVVADPSDRTVAVYRSLTDVRIGTEGDMLTLEEVLPGFSIPISALYS